MSRFVAVGLLGIETSGVIYVVWSSGVDLFQKWRYPSSRGRRLCIISPCEVGNNESDCFPRGSCPFQLLYSDVKRFISLIKVKKFCYVS